MRLNQREARFEPASDSEQLELLNNQNIIITAPSLNPTQNVSGVSTVVQFIIENNKEREYQHFQIGKTDKESGRALQRLLRIWKCYGEWRLTLTGTDKEDNQDNKDNY